MKGYIEHLIASSEEFSREIEREYKNIEVPYLSEAYKKWMLNKNGKTENVVRSYISYIKSADKEFFTFEEDFFILLPQKIQAGDFAGVSSLFDKYLGIIDEWFETSKKEDVGISTKKISDWRSGFRNYHTFIVEWLIPTMKAHLATQKGVQAIVADAAIYKRLFAEDDFLHWLIEIDNKGVSSAQSYVSRLKRLNRIVSDKCSAVLPKGSDIFSLIPKYLRENKGEEAARLLFALDEKLMSKIRQNDTSLMPIDILRNSVSSLRKYTKFLIEEYIDDISDNNEDSANDIKETSTIGGDALILTYDYEELEHNFHFRLITQDRMSNGKDVFFPIDIIKRLFRLSEKVSSKSSVSKGNYKWFNRWIDNCIAEIVVATDKGNFIMADLSEFNAITINTVTKEVTVKLQNGETAQMQTCTVEEASPIRLMEVDKLSNIHIDHTPLISDILSENLSSLPAMVRLTEIIRNVANASNLSITTKNFSDIARKVVNSKDYIMEMIELIPELKDEMELIREKTTLQLMEAGCNLRKK
ncbi:hypothetical protein [Bacteroides fragilis]|uniref:hypothetical protein n=1 Tax=Bacteroides fragilis TaxID=817 RepID=UPI002454C9E9|nr:hypothetical protein [Bacteroides fragilis]WPO59710.1 hypothetical protein SGJ39_20405 [Bacteroides fragilis]